MSEKVIPLRGGQTVPMEENAVRVVVVTPEQLKDLIREVIRQEFRGVNGHGEEDFLLTADEAAPLLNVTVRWLYRRASTTTIRSTPFAASSERSADGAVTRS